MPKLMLPYNGANAKTKKLIAPFNNANATVKRLYESNGAAWTKVFQGISVGDIYTIGSHNWTVVNVDSSTGQAIILCNDNLGTYPFAGQNVWYQSVNSPGYLGYYLNNTFYNTFSSEEKARIVTRACTYKNWTGDSWNTDIMDCNIWIPSMGEILSSYTSDPRDTVFQWFSQIGASAALNFFDTSLVTWTRTPYLPDSNFSSVQCLLGGAYPPRPSDNAYYFRPAILINP